MINIIKYYYQATGSMDGFIEFLNLNPQITDPFNYIVEQNDTFTFPPSYPKINNVVI